MAASARCSGHPRVWAACVNRPALQTKFEAGVQLLHIEVVLVYIGPSMFDAGAIVLPLACTLQASSDSPGCECLSSGNHKQRPRGNMSVARSARLVTRQPRKLSQVVQR